MTIKSVNLSTLEKKNILDQNLQDFAQDIGIICALEAGGKLDQRDAYKQIKAKWKELKANKKGLFPKFSEVDEDDID